MKKWFIGLLVVIVLSFAAVYIFIPRELDLNSIAYARCPAPAADRYLANQHRWDTLHALTHEADVFTISKRMYNGMELLIQTGDIRMQSAFHVLPINTDSVVLQWSCTLNTGNSPFGRIAGYRKALAVKKKMRAVLDTLAMQLNDDRHLYGYSIQRTSTIDTLLVATKTTLPYYARTPDIYRLVNTLKSYIASQGALQTGPPIMNVTRQDSNSYQLMVAIPTNKALPGSSELFFRKMVPGAFMVTDVRGGDMSVVYALSQMRLYFDDYKKISMAIPFAALITDRQQEPDSSRWVTRIYAPVY